MLPSPRASFALLLLTAGLLAGVPMACGFPEYGFKSEAASGSGGAHSTVGSGGKGGGTNVPECLTDADCVGSPKGSVCDTPADICVQCLPSKDMCPLGEF